MAFRGWQRTWSFVQLKILNPGLEWFLARTELLALADVNIFSFSSERKRDRGKTWSSSVAVRDFCSLPVGRARRRRTVSSSAHWKLVSYGLHR